MSWLYRGWIEELSKAEKKDEKTLAECRKEEATYYEQAYEGFLKAIASENFPMCGMDICRPFVTAVYGGGEEGEALH